MVDTVDLRKLGLGGLCTRMKTGAAVLEFSVFVLYNTNEQTEKLILVGASLCKGAG